MKKVAPELLRALLPVAGDFSVMMNKLAKSELFNFVCAEPPLVSTANFASDRYENGTLKNVVSQVTTKKDKEQMNWPR